jgi:hypothetical protein
MFCSVLTRTVFLSHAVIAEKRAIFLFDVMKLRKSKRRRGELASKKQRRRQ